MSKNKPWLDTQRKGKGTNGLTLPIISLGTEDLKLLRYMKDSKDSRFNVKAYSRDIAKIPKSTVYGKLNKFLRFGLVDHEFGINYKITQKGIHHIDRISGVQTHRQECRKGSLSTHFLRYKLLRNDKNFYDYDRFSRLNPIREIKTVKLSKNNFVRYAFFEDCSITIHSKVVYIKIYDVIEKDTEEAHFEAFTKALEYTDKLREIGLTTEGMELENPHYARVNSLLADFLKKNVDGRYFLELEDGSKFWIDESHPNGPEDETNREKVRNNVDNFMKKVMNGKINFDDLKEVSKIAGMLVAVEAMKMKESLKPKPELELEPPDYFG